MAFSWSVQQLAILAWFASEALQSLVVRARAGCGKTTTMVEGIKRYVAMCLTAKRAIRVLATAFNTKITDELKLRLVEFKDLGVQVMGLNALGWKFCRDAVRGVKLDTSSGRAFDISRAIEPKASNRAIQLLTKLHSKARELMPLATCGADLADLQAEFDLTCDDDLISEGWDDTGMCEAAYDCMVYASKNYQTMDFVDQIFLPVRNRWMRGTFDLIVVDETQDLSMAQLLLIQGSLRKGGKFCFVGDDQQAIYGFRGADVTALDRLKRETSADELALTVTRRCPKSHVAMAQNIVPDFTCSDDAPEGIVTDMKYDRDQMLEMATPGDFILSRTNAPLVPLCLSFLKRNVRAYVAGKAFGATLTSIVRRVKAANVADLAGKLNAWSAKEISKIKADKRAQDEEWLNKATELVSDKHDTIMAMADGMVTIDELIGRINSLCQESKDVNVPSIMLATVHKAKGLESERTWLCEGTFKYRNDEDERVRYVALTRSKHEMHLVKGFEPAVAAESNAA